MPQGGGGGGARLQLVKIRQVETPVDLSSRWGLLAGLLVIFFLGDWHKEPEKNYDPKKLPKKCQLVGCF